MSVKKRGDVRMNAGDERAGIPVDATTDCLIVSIHGVSGESGIKRPFSPGRKCCKSEMHLTSDKQQIKQREEQELSEFTEQNEDMRN
jgi:hypothetical protein